MTAKNQVKNKRLGKPVQIYVDDITKSDFERLVREYDPMLSIASAIRKLMMHAIAENYLPGYIRRERNVSNPLARSIEPANLGVEKRGSKLVE